MLKAIILHKKTKKKVLFGVLLSSFYGISSLWFAFFRELFSEHEIPKMSYRELFPLIIK